MRRTRRQPPSRSGGFTLPELLVSIAITALVMVSVFGTLYYTTIARDQVHNLAERHNAGPAILDRIESDLRQIWIYNLPANRVFLGRDLTVSGAQADAIDFVASASSSELLVEDRRIRSRVSEVGWHLRANPANADFLELYRREDFFVDDEIFSGGTYERVYDRVKFFNVTYFADLGPDAEPLDEWATEAQGKFPRRIRIDLGVETQPRLERGESPAGGLAAPLVAEFSRTIVAPPDLDRMLAARLRPSIPSAPQRAGNTIASAAGAGMPGGGRGGANVLGGVRTGNPANPGRPPGPGGGGHGAGGGGFPFPVPGGGGSGGGGIFVPH